MSQCDCSARVMGNALEAVRRRTACPCRCMMDFRPRHLQGGMYVLFANLAEIVQVELEREMYLDSHDILKNRFPAEGPVPLSIPMRHLSHMSATTPPLSSRSSEAPPDADELGTIHSGNSGTARAAAGGESKLSNLGLPGGLKTSLEAKQAVGQDAADVDLSELAEAWWITAQNGWPPDPSPTLRDQLRERVGRLLSSPAGNLAGAPVFSSGHLYRAPTRMVPPAQESRCCTSSQHTCLSCIPAPACA